MTATSQQVLTITIKYHAGAHIVIIDKLARQMFAGTYDGETI